MFLHSVMKTGPDPVRMFLHHFLMSDMMWNTPWGSLSFCWPRYCHQHSLSPIQQVVKVTLTRYTYERTAVAILIHKELTGIALMNEEKPVLTHSLSLWFYWYISYFSPHCITFTMFTFKEEHQDQEHHCHYVQIRFYCPDKRRKCDALAVKIKVGIFDLCFCHWYLIDRQIYINEWMKWAN